MGSALCLFGLEVTYENLFMDGKKTPFTVKVNSMKSINEEERGENKENSCSGQDVSLCWFKRTIKIKDNYHPLLACGINTSQK